MELNQKLEAVCRQFRIEGQFVGYETIHTGNVNHTYQVKFIRPNGEHKSYLLQNVNTYAFRNPIQLMENIDRVTEHIRAKRPGQLSLHFHHTAEGKNYVLDGDNFWRMMNFIYAMTFDSIDDLYVIRNAGKAFGEFQNQLSDFDSTQLYETIPDFHNTRKRYEQLEAAVALDPVGRVQEVQAELAYLASVKDLACTLTDMQMEGKLPIRVTHNDTKINNVMFDPQTGDALVVVDLDTVMPGLVGHDFGDAIRFAANVVEEDCPDVEKVGVDLEVFRAFAFGFLEQTVDTLTPNEINTLAVSCVALTLELCTRFLTDYILGDPYFKIKSPDHNLVRTRCQIALAKDMQKHMDHMERIVGECVVAAHS